MVAQLRGAEFITVQDQMFPDSHSSPKNLEIATKALADIADACGLNMATYLYALEDLGISVLDRVDAKTLN